jgi:Zn-dependent metalloprotease
MNRIRNFKRSAFSSIASVFAIASMTLSLVQPQPAQAQSGDGIKREVNAESRKVSFIGPESGRSVPALKALGTFIRPQNPPMALVKRFGPEFGLQDPERDLSEIKNKRDENGRVTVRYQQKYQGIPVLGGELIVNTNDQGDLYSMNGEVSPNLSLSIQPTIDAARARQTALQSLAKWYQKQPSDFVATEPALWIYDESLLQPSTRPVELVWRMEITSANNDMPVRELVLVNAQRGGISLHFNQIDTAWTANAAQDTDPTPTPAPTDTLLPIVEPTVIHELPVAPDAAPSTDATTTDGSLADSPDVITAATWYVATTGNNSNTCTSAGSPCLTINVAIGKPAVAAGDIIKVATGTYTGTGTEVVLINKSVTLSGGWNAAFTTQGGISTIDGQGARLGVTISGSAISVIDRFKVQNGSACEAGGIRVWGGGTTLTLNNSTISNNTKTCSNAGGGIYNDGNTTINDSSVSNNIGGGIGNSSGTLTLNNSTISANVNNSSGGGIGNAGIATLNNSTISGNTLTANSGGGIYNSGSLILNNITISDNSTATGSGGGIQNENGTVTIRNTIIAMNTANTAVSGPDCSGSISSGGYNLIGNNSGCTFSATTGDLVGTSASPINPRLTPLQNNGGPTFTHALMVGSPAIDAGNPAAPGSGGNACLATDQRGVARPVGAKCDIGAYEGFVAWVPSPLVNTYTANNTSSLPGTFLCNQSQQPCTISNANPHADAAHKYAIGTYNFYASKHLRDSIDNNGMIIKSTVQYCDPSFPCPYDNAYWDGTQMVYGSAHGYPLADDVVAHELTHGVTQYESNLFYYYQSGAINESFSDLWGEYYDQINGQGVDLDVFKWLIGEDVVGLGAERSMNNPTVYGDPDKMTSPYYHMSSDDSGGVHENSGVNNKAVFLMVDGGTFNGRIVSAMGWDKVGAIYYEVNTNLLGSGADYSDLYYALQQACTNLIGQKGITSADCVEVRDAIEAVEMNAQPVANFNTHAPLCAAGTTPSIVFSDDLESGTGNWFFNNGFWTRWQYDSPYGPYTQSGLHSLYADDYPDQASLALAQLASINVPANAYLHFAQAYGFEQGYVDGSSTLWNFDGGVLEYSINGGATWADAGSLIDYNGYKGAIAPSWGNPLANRLGFVGDSHGYISTRLNLASLAGKTVTFRWMMGLDNLGYAAGWWLDDVKLYSCAAAPLLVNSVLPTSRSVQVGTTATVFNTVLNGGGATASGVTLAMANPPAGAFAYQESSCATNALLGGMNPSLDIAAGGARCYVLFFTPASPFASTDVHIRAQASNAAATNLLPGINTWTLRATGSPGPDMIALTTTTDFHQLACSGLRPFAVAMSNVGAATSQVTVTADTGFASLPLSFLIQESNPATGAIIGDHILENVGAGENRTVVVWVTFNGCVGFDPAANRIFIRFKDAGNNLIGSTSTAVSTNR